MTSQQDRNFDSLIKRFAKIVYGTQKGEWRLKILQEDLAEFIHPQPPLPSEPSARKNHDKSLAELNIWDAGCGFGQISQILAQSGHKVLLSDLSYKMLEEAQQNFNKANLSAEFKLGAAQDLADELPEFDLVIFHAVLEWLAQPKETLQKLVSRVRPGGYLSLLFYNRNAMVYTNVLKGQWRWEHILNDTYLGKGKRLTPPNPQFPFEVESWLAEWGFSIEKYSGIRVFNDYLTEEVKSSSDADELWQLEEKFCRIPGFREMGRYIHLLALKS